MYVYMSPLKLRAGGAMLPTAEGIHELAEAERKKYAGRRRTAPRRKETLSHVEKKTEVEYLDPK